MNYNQRPVDQFIKESQRILQKEFVIVSTQRVSSVFAWLLIGLVAGITGTGAYVASRSGTLEESQAANEVDQIKVDYRYIRDYFTPQITGIEVHKEIKSSMICNAKNCPGILGEGANTTKGYLANKNDDNKYLIFYIPRVGGRFVLNLLVGAKLASAGVVAVGQACPTDPLQRCNAKSEKFDGGAFHFLHTAGQDQIIQVSGLDKNTYDQTGGVRLTGKQSVQYFLYYGDSAGFSLNPFLSAASWLAYAILVDDSLKSTQDFSFLRTQMFPNTRYALNNCTMVFHSNVLQGSPLANALDQGVALFQSMFNFLHVRLVHGDGISWSDMPTTLDQKSKDKLVADNGTNNIAITTDPNARLFKDHGQSTGDPGLTEGYIGATELNGENLSGSNNLISTLVRSVNIALKVPGFDPNNSDHMKSFLILMMQELGHTLSGRDQRTFDLIPYDPQTNTFFVPPPVYHLVKGTYACAAGVPSPAPTCTIEGPSSVTPGQNVTVGWYVSGDATSATVSWDNDTSFTPLRLSNDAFVGSGLSDFNGWTQAWQNVHKNTDDKPSKVTVTATGPGGSGTCGYVLPIASTCKALNAGGSIGDTCHSTISVEQ